MFGKLADFIMKHAKLIICVWVILLVASAPSIYKVLAEPETIMQYDMTTMLSGDTESAKGSAIMNDSSYFYQADLGTDMILVVECGDEETRTAVENILVPAVKTDLLAYYDPDGAGDILSVVNVGFSSKTVDEDGKMTVPGIELVSIAFKDGRSSTAEISKVRSIISDTKANLRDDPLCGDIQFTTYVTGNTAMTQDNMDGAVEDVKKIDPFSVLLVLVLIGLFFRSILSSTTPPITIGFAYGVLMLVIVLLSNVMGIYYITSTLALVSMLGAGCDYCIFIIARYREERMGGKDKDNALHEAIVWAGESITTSGLSVIIGFGVMSFCSFSLVSTMGVVLAIGIILALLAALTLIPSIIMLLGDRIFIPSTVESYKEGSKAMSGWYGFFSNLGKSYFRSSVNTSLKHAWAIVAVAIIVSEPLGYVAFTETTSYDMVTTLPDGEAKNGINAIVANADGGLVMPTYIVLEVTGQIADVDPEGIVVKDDHGQVIDILGTLKWIETPDTPAGQHPVRDKYTSCTTDMPSLPIEADGLAKDITLSDPENIASIRGLISSTRLLMATPTGKWSRLLNDMGGLLPDEMKNRMSSILDYWSQGHIAISDIAPSFDYLLNYYLGSISVYKDGHQYVTMTVNVKDQPMSDRSMKTLKCIESTVSEFMKEDSESLEPMFQKSYITGTVVDNEVISNIVDGEFTYIEIAVVILIFILLFAVMRSYFTPIRSIVTIVMSIIWTLGVTHLLFGHVLGMPVTWIVPIVLFVICLGLGMDYDILLTTRVKENISKGMSNDDAIAHAVEKSGAVITICGLIMGGAFLTMVLSTSPMLMEFGFALGFAILVDALIIRTYVVPAVMHLMGRWNWVGPSGHASAKKN